MSTRSAKRPAGVTRIPKVQADVTAAADDALTVIDLTGWAREDLDRVAVDRNLSTSGSDEDVAARITADIEGA